MIFRKEFGKYEIMETLQEKGVGIDMSRGRVLFPPGSR